VLEFTIGHDLKALTDGLDSLWGKLPKFASDYIGINYRAGKSYFVGSNWRDAEAANNEEQLQYYPQSIEELKGADAVADTIHAKLRTLGGQLGRSLNIKALPPKLQKALEDYKDKIKEYQEMVEQESGITNKKNITAEEVAKKLNYRNVPEQKDGSISRRASPHFGCYPRWIQKLG
jgi:hypothetical protein